MTEQTRDKLQRTRKELSSAEELTPESRDNLHSLLDAAGKAANGLSDEERIRAVSDALLELSIIEVQKSVRSVGQIQEQVSAAISNHTNSCPFSSRGKLVVSFVKTIMPWIMTLLITALQLFGDRLPYLRLQNRHSNGELSLSPVDQEDAR